MMTRNICIAIIAVAFFCACDIRVTRKNQETSVPEPSPAPSPATSPGPGGPPPPNCQGTVIPRSGSKAWSISKVMIGQGNSKSFCVNIEGIKKINSGINNLISIGAGIRVYLTQSSPVSQTCGCQGPFDEYGMPADYNSCALVRRADMVIKKDDAIVGSAFAEENGIFMSVMLIPQVEPGWYQITVTNKTKCKPFDINVGVYGTDYIPE